MLNMWHEQPENRPTFSAIVQTLEHFMEVSNDYLELGNVVSTNFPGSYTDEGDMKEQTSCASGCSEGDEVTSLPGDHRRHSILDRVVSSPNDYTYAGDLRL